MVDVYTGASTVCACPWGYSVVSGSTPAGACAPPITLSLTSDDGTLPPSLTGSYVLAPLISLVGGPPAQWAAGVDAAAGCGINGTAYSGRTWLNVGDKTTTLWYDPGRGEWSLGPSTTPGGPRYAFIPSGTVNASAYPGGLTPDAATPTIQRYGGNASSSLGGGGSVALPLGVQPWRVYAGFVQRFLPVTSTSSSAGGAVLSIVRAPPLSCSLSAASDSPLPSPSVAGTPTPSPTPGVSAAWRTASTGGSGAAGVATLSVTVNGSRCLNLLEVWAVSTAGQHVLQVSERGGMSVCGVVRVLGGGFDRIQCVKNSMCRRHVTKTNLHLIIIMLPPPCPPPPPSFHPNFPSSPPPLPPKQPPR